jgi:hypothetical protein
LTIRLQHDGLSAILAAPRLPAPAIVAGVRFLGKID